MKNTIKLTIIFGIVISFFPVYPMRHEVALDTLGETGKFLNESDFSIKRTTYCNWENIPVDSPLYTDQGLPLVLTAVTLLGELGEDRRKKTLKTICDAVSKGMTSLISNFVVRAKQSAAFDPVGIRIFSSQGPSSVFILAENLFDNPPLFKDYLARIGRQRPWMEAVFQGYDKRKKNSTFTCNVLAVCARNQLQVVISEDLLFLMVSYFPECYISTEDEEAIKQAKQKPDKEQQLLQRLNEENSYFGKIIDCLSKASKKRD